MAPSPKKPSTSAEVALSPLKNCLVNLPTPLVAVLGNINVAVQNVVIELQYKAPSADSELKVQKFAYLGWTGLPSRGRPSRIVNINGSAGGGGREQETSRVEIDAVFATLLGLFEGQKVSVSLHLDPPTVHTVNVEPLTPSDWEIIEMHGNFLELNLLSQVRALPNPNYSRTGSSQAEHAHPLTLHLSPTSTVKIIVTSLVPVVPSSSPFAKISPNAEVIVAPKLRAKISRSNREDDRSVLSTGRRSGRSARSGGNSPHPASKSIVLLRVIDHAVCHEWFGPDDEENPPRKLIIWVHSDALEKQPLRGTNWVAISVIRPGGLRAPLDQHQAQQLKEQESGEPGLPSTQVVAELQCWTDAPDEQQAAVSSPLCSVLGFERMVGCIVSLEAAPNPLQRSELNGIKLYPFLPDSSLKQEGLRFGGDTRLSKQAIAILVKEIFGAANGLLEGPLSDGMLLPATSDETSSHHRFAGGIVRFDSFGGENRGNSLSWLLGSEYNLGIDVQSEIPRTMDPAVLFPTFGSSLPKDHVHLVGFDHIVAKCMSSLAHGSSVLVTGGNGSGKTSLVHLLCQRLTEESLFNATYFSCRRLVTDETRISTVGDTLTRLFMSASWCARLGGHSIVVLDDLDKICPVEAELQAGNDNGRSRLITEVLCSAVRYYCVPGSGIVLLASATSRDSLNHIIISGHILGEVIDLKAPEKEIRRKILAKLVTTADRQAHHSHSNSDGRNQDSWMGPLDANKGLLASTTERIVLSPSVDLLDLAGRTDGFMPSDLELLISRARNECLIRTIAAPGDTPTTDLMLTSTDFATALKNFTPSALRAVPLTRSTTTFSSVGGLHETRNTLLETLLYPTKYAPVFSSCPLRLRSGLLLYGYPGCGKTLLASAVAGECGLNFISIKGPEILNKYIGASEKSVRDLFERAQAAKPCVLFFDEFDSVAPKRGHDSTGVTDRVVNQLLTQMDGAEGLEGVYVLAATSRPDLIDPALLRPGRLDKSLLCDLPDLAERIDILTAVSNEKLVLDGRVEEMLKELAARTEGFSGADLQALMYNAHLEAVHELIGNENISNKISSYTTKRKGGKRGPVNGTSPARNSKNIQQTKLKGKSPRKLVDDDFIQFLYSPEADAAARSGKSTTKAIFEPPPLIAEKVAAIESARKTEKRQHRQLSSSLGLSDRYVNSDRGYEKEEDGHEKDKDHQQQETIVRITWENVEKALSSTRCSISQHERDRLKAIYREFVVGRNGEMPSGQGGREVGGRSSLM